MRACIACLVLCLAYRMAVADGSVLPPATERFAGRATDETPSFQRHVIPLLGRLGCNGRECHGSFQGQGGFRLSLFGYDFAADHAALTGDDEPRVNLGKPSSSRMLQKPTLTIDHGGGQRFQPDGWEHRLLLRWIAAGAPAAEPNAAELTALEIEPCELVFGEPGQMRPLRVFATWSDGSREDVTPLCRFRTNDESIAAASTTGVITAVGTGDTHVVVFYDNGITPVPVILPVSDRLGPRYPDILAPTRIDELVLDKLRKVGVVPSDLSSDAEFLRRVSLDVTGTLPTPEEITAFLSDRSPDKRTGKVDELLARPTYAAWWTTRLCDILGNTEQNLPVGGEQGVRREKTAQWYDWVYRRVHENTPYDEIVAGIVLATSRRPGQSDDEYYAEMSSYFREQEPGDFSARETMPYFWTRGRFSPPQTLRFSYAFLGIRLECAECHKHPYDQWTKEDYEGFQAFFERVQYKYARRDRASELKKTLGLTADQDSGEYKRLFARLVHEGQTVPWGELQIPQSRRQPDRRKKGEKLKAGRVITPKLLGGEQVVTERYDDPREPLIEWLRQDDNPYFARALVNRVWAGYFGVGIVDPPDDMNLANPPSNGPLLDYLARAFVEHGYDLKWLHREIATSRTYQLSWRPNATNQLDERNFSRALVRRLPAEVAYDALVHATAADEPMRAMHTDRAAVRARHIGASSGYSGRYEGNYVLKLFGKPAREGVCDCERSSEPTLLQTMFLRNDAEMLGLLDRHDGWLQDVARDADRLESRRDELVRQAYLRTFCRMPSDEETRIGREHLDQAEDTVSGLRDLLWALLNSKEFILNH